MHAEAIEEGDEEVKRSTEKSAQMKADEVVIQYGPETIKELHKLLKSSFKVFWDGSISLYKDTVHSSTNNKEFLNKLLDVRMASD